MLAIPALLRPSPSTCPKTCIHATPIFYLAFVFTDGVFEHLLLSGSGRRGVKDAWATVRFLILTGRETRWCVISQNSNTGGRATQCGWGWAWGSDELRLVRWVKFKGARGCARRSALQAAVFSGSVAVWGEQGWRDACGVMCAWVLFGVHTLWHCQRLVWPHGVGREPRAHQCLGMGDGNRAFWVSP